MIREQSAAKEADHFLRKQWSQETAQMSVNFRPTLQMNGVDVQIRFHVSHINLKVIIYQACV